MSANQENFRIWYARVLEYLSKDGHAGFAMLMIAFPILERYLREKSGVHEGNLNDKSYDELRAVFPMLVDKKMASDFWHVYRNGLLHQVTMSQQNRAGLRMPDGWLSGDAEMISVDGSGSFWVHPAKFSFRVIEVIDADFATFEGAHSVNHPLPVVHHAMGATATPTLAYTTFTAPPTGTP